MPDELYKSDEFDTFITLIKEGQYDTWELVADTLGVHKNTIQLWKKHPKAQKALADGLQHAIAKMEQTGQRDWRMWREKTALIRKELDKKKEDEKPVTNIQINVGDDVLTKYLYGFVQKLAGGSTLPEDTATSPTDASSGEGTIIRENNPG